MGELERAALVDGLKTIEEAGPRAVAALEVFRAAAEGVRREHR